MSLQTVYSHIAKNWKTSLSGCLSAVIGFSAVASTPNPWIPSSLGIKILGAAAISKVMLGLMQTDGSHVDVKLPDNTPVQVNMPAGSEIQQTTTIHTPEGK